MQPVNVASITEALKQNFIKSEVIPPEAQVTRAEEINELPSACPWIGIYRSAVQYPIRTLGGSSGFRNQRVELIVVVQESDLTSGEQCEDRLEALILKVIRAIFDDVYIGGTCDTVDDFAVRYESYTKRDGTYMQTASIYFTAITRPT